jgi:hypothetical protein
MSQRDRLREMDAELMLDCLDEDLADQASYLPPAEDAEAVAVDVFVDDESLDRIGDLGPGAASTRREVCFLRAQLANPEKRGVVTVGDVGWKLEEKVFEDDSQSRWVVTRVRP